MKKFIAKGFASREGSDLICNKPFPDETTFQEVLNTAISMSIEDGKKYKYSVSVNVERISEEHWESELKQAEFDHPIN